ncbi:MAG TPA: pseudouridine synthase [Gillisia sp.]|nr:pseudouridine synthase [Gillisia sp.]
MPVSNYKIYKPYGFLSQFVNNQPTRKNKKLLGDLYNFPEGTMAIGRLDEDSEGLLLLTTCGSTSEEVRSKSIEKEYYVQVDGIVTPLAIKNLKIGIEIGVDQQKYTTLPSKVYLLKEQPILPQRSKKIRDERHGPTSWISIILTEGKFRQIRKMTAAVGFPTLRLVRVRVGNEVLGEMLPGEVIPVKSDFNLNK